MTRGGPPSSPRSIGMRSFPVGTDQDPVVRRFPTTKPTSVPTPRTAIPPTAMASTRPPRLRRIAPSVSSLGRLDRGPLVGKAGGSRRAPVGPRYRKKSQELPRLMVRAQNVSKYFGAKRALGPVSFEIGDGETVGFLGLN